MDSQIYTSFSHISTYGLEKNQLFCLYLKIFLFSKGFGFGWFPKSYGLFSKNIFSAG